MFRKILIANRGEIACRVIRTAKRLGIRTVAVYSDADTNSLHVQMADEAIRIGEAAPAQSYLLMDRIIQAATQSGAEAIHPGYGFLAENAAFCRLCASHGLVFIGPPAVAIETMGSKSAAKRVMEQAKVPLLPGYHGADQNPELLKQSAAEIGYPVLVKAVAGGGGKGMREIRSTDEFDQALAAAKREAQASFGDAAMLVEKYLEQPRHVEVQVFCDAAGAGVYLFERDCSIQRRHQKIVEEAPAPKLAAGLRKRMGEAALRAAKAVDYVGAGTVEFLLDKNGDFYFMEMNTRLQVEHPVTEMITGQDLVEWQLKVANGEALPASQADLKITGHAIEARIYAEDPANDFLPAAGKLSWLQQPEESAYVRVDTGVVQGDEVGVFYDPMIAKLIVWDENRQRALQRLAQALSVYRIVGVTTNIDFLRRVALNPAFVAGRLSTDFISQNRLALFDEKRSSIESLVSLAGLFLTLRRQAAPVPAVDQTSPWHARDHWRLNAPRVHHETIVVDEAEYVIAVQQVSRSEYLISFDNVSCTADGYLDGNELVATVDGHRQTAVIVEEAPGIHLFTEGGLLQFTPKPPDLGDEAAHDDGSGFKAPMNGTVVDVLVNAGDQVSRGETLVILEAMKMEHPVKAPRAGTIGEIFFAKGDLVKGGSALLAFQPRETGS